MLFGDSLTAMGYISKHVKDKLHEYGLTNAKLVGVNTNLDDSENRYTATGGYSWDNYTKIQVYSQPSLEIIICGIQIPTTLILIILCKIWKR